MQRLWLGLPDVTTSADIVNRALELAGNQVTVSGSNPAFDGTPAGNAAGVLYTPALQLLLRQMDPAFARRTATLVVAGGTTPPPWTQEYTYPADCLRVRAVRPAAGSYSLNDPQPIRAAIAFDNGLAAKVIVSNTASALAVYTSTTPNENQFDPAFVETLARRLASPLAMALDGRPDFARELLEEAERYASMSELVDEN